MNWILGIFGALIGIAVSDSRWLMGATTGFLSLYLLMSAAGLRRRIDAQDRELERLRNVLENSRATVTPTPDTVAEPAAPTATVSAPAPLDQTAAKPAVVGTEILPPVFDPATIAAARARFEERERQRTKAANEPAQRRAENTARPSSTAPASIRYQPDVIERFGARIRSWFTEGNVPVKIGVLVLFAGVAAALRYAAAQGYFTFPIEYRFMAVAVAALAGLVFGWRERELRPAFGLSLQGGALGVLLLTVFAAYNLYGLLPATLAFSLIVVLVAGAALLAVLQKNMPLAALGFLGGYLAPVLINTGSNNYIGLFTYYAVLNAAVFAISWKQSWRLLNIIGFVFTFGVGSTWGASNYRPEMFNTVEPFLILFFVFYLLIGLLYVIRQSEYRRPWVDGTLVFGTPLVAFPLQASLLKDNRMALAFSALIVAVIYAGLVTYLRRRRDERLLTEAYGALALGFATLAIPLAFSAGTTASLWALEGVGAAWLGIRQNRKLPWLGGLILQLLAAGSYVISMQHTHVDALLVAEPLLLNASWFGAAILAFSGFALSLIHDRHRPIKPIAALFFLWATFWWLVAAGTQYAQASTSIGEWRFLMATLVGTIVLAALARAVLSWLRLNWMIAFAALSGLLMLFFAEGKYQAPFVAITLPLWALYAVTMIWALAGGRESPSRSLAFAHVLGLWTLAIAFTLQLEHINDTEQLAQGWHFVATITPVALLTLGLWRAPNLFAWPRAELFAGYRNAWFGLAIPLLLLAVVVGLFLEGSASPLPYLPIVNPLELTLLVIVAVMINASGNVAAFAGLHRVLPLFGFVFLTMATLRAVHHWHGEAWTSAILNSGFTQTSLTIIWSLLGVGSMLLGSSRVRRPLWLGGMVLMIIVCAKLVIIDRHYMGNMPGIVSFLAVGLLLVGVGYFAPSPPKTEEGARA